MEDRNTAIPRTVRLLGYAGLIPFVALAALFFLADPEWRYSILWALCAYAAVIVSFLGAIHWGLAMHAESSSHWPYIWGVTPCLLAWACLLPPPAVGLCLLAAVLWACLLVDRNAYPGFGVAHWLRMRLILTTVASICCGLAGVLA